MVIIFAACAYGETTTPRLSPVPRDVKGIKQVRIDLNGEWEFNPLPAADFWNDQKITGQGWAKIQVPGEWVMQGFVVPDKKPAVYVKEFSIDPTWADKRVKLRCEGVYSYARVWMNGTSLGSHLGGFTPFEIDVTKSILPGKTNRLVLAVESDSIADKLASATQYAVHKPGGIIRDIMLFAVEKVNIASLHIDTRFDNEYKNAVLELAIQVANESNADLDNLDFDIRLTNPQGRSLDIAKPGKLFSIVAEKTEVITLDIPVTAPLKWDAEHPNLYTLSCSLVRSGVQMETIVNRFGFRQIEVRGNQLFVNNMPVKLHGVDRHETHPFLARAQQPKDAYYRDIDLFRQANVNYIRTSHYPPPQQLLDACDELGMFVEVEAPFCWAHLTPVDPNQINALYVTPMLEMVEEHRNHPSVLIWSVGNESPNWKNFQPGAQAIGKVDPSRPRNFSQGQPGDDSNFCEIANAHYPGLKGPQLYKNSARPVIYDEYAHINCYNRFELVTDPGVRDFWGDGFTEMWNRMYASKACLGGAVWCGIDEVFFKPDGDVIGYGTWGIIDEWRRPKPEYWYVKKAYSPLHIPETNLPEITPGKPLVLHVENRHDFTDLSEIRFEWTCGSKSGQASAIAAPHASGELEIPVTASELGKNSLHIKAVGPRGFVIDEYHFAAESDKTADYTYSVRSAKPVLAADANDYFVRTSDATYKIDKNTGTLTADIDNKPVLFGGPELMILPLNGAGGSQMTGKEVLFTPYTASCSQWKCGTVSASEVNDTVVVNISGEYKEANGNFVLTFDNNFVTTGYDFALSEDIKPRQVGLVWKIDASYSTLKWNRKSKWSIYPEDHIGRPVGTANAFSGIMFSDYAGPHIRPTWSWSQDQTQLGSNDFRSTKLNILQAQLVDSNSTGITIVSDGTQHFRSWVDGKQIKFLVADYANEGAERFYFEHIIANKPLKPGSRINGAVKFFINPLKN